MSGPSIFSMVRTTVDGFFEGLLSEVPHHVNPNLRATLTIRTFWSKGTDNNGNPIPAAGLQVQVAVYPGVVASVPTNVITFSGGQFQTGSTAGTVVAAPGGTTPPIAQGQGVTDQNGNLTFVLQGSFDTSQSYYVGFGDNWPNGASDTSIQELGFLAQPQSDWGGAEGPTYGFTTGAAYPLPGGTSQGKGGQPHHGKMP